jgi:heme exporter protein A
MDLASSNKTLEESNSSAIEVDGITKSFGHIYALRGVNLRLEEGEFLTIFGPNGAGKTTLIRILSTLVKPTSGKGKVAGFDLNSDGEEVRKRIGVVSHSPFLYDNLTAYENLRFYARMYEIEHAEARILQVLEDYGLKSRMNDPVRTFSRGMLQRLSIARAIIHEPSIMFLDEPYTGLDQHAARVLKELLQRIHSDNRTVVMTTHDISLGLEMCDKVAILVAGQILFLEEVKEQDFRLFSETYFHYVGEEALR